MRIDFMSTNPQMITTKNVAKWLFLAIAIPAVSMLLMIGGCTAMLLTAASQYEGGDGYASSSATGGTSNSVGSKKGAATFGFSCQGLNCQGSQFGLSSNRKE
jgi:hypothetical protein